MNGIAGVLLCVATVLAPPAFAADFIRGDCNADGSPLRGRCSISDAIFLFNHIYNSGPEPTCKAACDVNHSGVIDITDGIFILLHCILGGGRPPEPYPYCGPEDPELLGCELYTPCEVWCLPQEAQGVGECETVLGSFWDGRRCAELSGCACEGADCGYGFPSTEECYHLHGGCEILCAPMDVAPAGEPCSGSPRWYYDGSRCQRFDACECSGADCDRLYESGSDCYAATRACPRPPPPEVK
jgi:hypothetical protein